MRNQANSIDQELVDVSTVKINMDLPVEERIKELEASEADTKAALKKLRAKAKK